MTAIFISNFSNINFAARLPSFIFGIALLILTGILAQSINKDNPYCAPAAMLILSSFTLYWELTVSALLDTGMVFFSVCAVLGTLLALREPRYWYLVGAAVGVGALQKAPLAALLVGGILLLIPLTKRYHAIKISSVLKSKHFRLALLIAVLMIAWWPALQTIIYGYKAIKQQYVSQMLERFNPIGPGQSNDWYQIFIADDGTIWLPAILSVIVIPFFFRNLEAFIPVTIVLSFFFLMGMASGYVSARYSLLILPFVAASLAALLGRILPPPTTALMLALGLCFLVGGPFKGAEALGLMSNGQEAYKPLLENLRTSLRPDDTLISCGWQAGPQPTVGILPGVLSYYGSNGHPIYSLKRPEELTKQEHIKHKIQPPYRGLCRSPQFEELKGWLLDYDVVEQSNGYVHFTSNGSVSLR